MPLDSLLVSGFREGRERRRRKVWRRRRRRSESLFRD